MCLIVVGQFRTITYRQIQLAHSSVCQGSHTLAHPSDLRLDKGYKTLLPLFCFRCSCRRPSFSGSQPSRLLIGAPVPRLKFAQREVVDLSQLFRTNPCKFWQAACLPNVLLPRELHYVAAWDSFLVKLTAPPAQRATQLPPPHTPQPPAPAHSPNQPLTLAEVEVGLQHLHNGRSGALHGYTSQLLRYAQLVTTPDDPAPAHLLALCLEVFRWQRTLDF